MLLYAYKHIYTYTHTHTHTHTHNIYIHILIYYIIRYEKGNGGREVLGGLRSRRRSLRSSLSFSLASYGGEVALTLAPTSATLPQRQHWQAPFRRLRAGGRPCARVCCACPRVQVAACSRHALYDSLALSHAHTRSLTHSLSECLCRSWRMAAATPTPTCPPTPAHHIPPTNPLYQCPLPRPPPQTACAVAWPRAHTSPPHPTTPSPRLHTFASTPYYSISPSPTSV
jgi:hypothetical protein